MILSHPVVRKISRIVPKLFKILAVKIYHDIGLIILCKNPVNVLLARWSRSYPPSEHTLHLRNGMSIKIELGTSDAQTLAEIFWESVYTPRFLRRIYQEARVVCDVGANKGFFCLYAAQAWPKAIVHGYEPDQKLYSIAKQNLIMNDLEHRIFLHNKAVYQTKGNILFRVATGANRGVGHVVNTNQEQTNNAIPVDAVTISDIVEEIGAIDFLKVDVEGTEYRIFTVEHVAALRKVKFISLEWHDVTGCRIEQITDVLRNAGFRFLVVRRMLYAWRE